MAVVGKQKSLLGEKLQGANTKIEKLNDALLETKDHLIEQLNTFGIVKTQYNTFKELVTSLRGTLEVKFTEAQDLEQEKEKLMKQIEGLKAEVEARKLEASQFNKDLHKEMKDREAAAKQHIEELAFWRYNYKKLEEECIKDRADFSDELMGKNQQVRQCKRQVEEFKGQLQNALVERDKVKGQLHQAIATTQECEEQLFYYQRKIENIQTELRGKEKQLDTTLQQIASNVRCCTLLEYCYSVYNYYSPLCITCTLVNYKLRHVLIVM